MVEGQRSNGVAIPFSMSDRWVAKHGAVDRSKTLTVGTLGGGVEEEESLVDDTSRGASSTDQTTHDSGGSPGHKRHHAVCRSAASLQQHSHPSYDSNGCKNTPTLKASYIRCRDHATLSGVRTSASRGTCRLQTCALGTLGITHGDRYAQCNRDGSIAFGTAWSPSPPGRSQTG